MKRCLALLLFNMVCLVVGPWASASDAGFQFLEAYFAIQQGDAAIREGNAARAEAKFTRALDTLREIKTTVPEWNPEIVQYRLTYCENQLARLRAQRGETVAPGPVRVADSERVRQLTEELARAREQIQQLEAVRDQLQARLQATPAAAPEASPELAELQKRNRELATELVAAQMQLAAARESAERAAAPELTARLQQDLAAVRQELTRTKAELEQVRTQLTSARADLERSQADSTKLRASYDQVLAQLTDANRQLEAARAAVAKDGEIIRQLRKENALLRVVTDRQAIPTAGRADSADGKKWWRPFAGEKMRAEKPVTQPVQPVAPPPAAAEAVAAVQPGEPRELVAELKAPPPPPQPEPPPAAPSSVAVRRLISEGKAALDKGDWDTAEARLQAAVAAEPQNLAALNNLGVLHYRRGQLEQAEATMQRAVQLAPNDSAARALLGVIYFRKGRLDEAFGELTKAVALDPRNAEAHNYLGITLVEKGWAAAAETEMRRAVELNPKYADAHFNLAVIYARQKTPRWDLAQHHYDKAISLGAAPDPQLEQLIRNRR